MVSYIVKLVEILILGQAVPCGRSVGLWIVEKGLGPRIGQKEQFTLVQPSTRASLNDLCGRVARFRLKIADVGNRGLDAASNFLLDQVEFAAGGALPGYI